VQVQKISILPPQKELKFPGGWGILEDQKFKEMCEASLEFQRGGGLRKHPFRGEVMVIFWNYALKNNRTKKVGG